jgi:hypothetical protein
MHIRPSLRMLQHHPQTAFTVHCCSTHSQQPSELIKAHQKHITAHHTCLFNTSQTHWHDDHARAPRHALPACPHHVARLVV